MEENKIFGSGDLYNFKAAPFLLPSTVTVVLTQGRQGQEVTLLMSHVGSIGDSSREGQLSILCPAGCRWFSAHTSMTKAPLKS